MNDFTLQTEEPAVAYQIWMRIKKQPQLATSLTVARIAALPEFSHVEKNVLSAAVSDLSNIRGVLSKIDKLGRAFVYGPGPNWNVPQKFGFRVTGKKLRREPGYKQTPAARPAFGLQPSLDLGQNTARDETRERLLKVARGLPLDVLEQVVVEKRAAEKKT